MPKIDEAPTKVAPSPPGGGGPPDDGLPVLSSLDLSWLAETADGTRDKNLFLIRKDKAAPEIKNEEEVVLARKSGNVEVLARVYTESSLPARTKVLLVTCEVEDADAKKLDAVDPIKLDPKEGWDAIFWTESAVEKFLYPYYHSQRLWNKDMDKLRAKFKSDPTAVAIAHRAPSYSLTLQGGGAQTISVAQTETGKGVQETQLKWVELSDYIKGR